MMPSDNKTIEDYREELEEAYKAYIKGDLSRQGYDGIELAETPADFAEREEDQTPDTVAYELAHADPQAVFEDLFKANLETEGGN